jgi:hypothetical protein
MLGWACFAPLFESSPIGPGSGDPIRANVPSSIGPLPFPIGYPCENDHELTAVKMTPTSGQDQRAALRL